MSVGCAVGVVLLGACTGGGGRDVVVGTVGRADVVEIVNAPATVAPRAQATVSAPADGTYAEVFVADGDRVKAGQPLLRIASKSAEERLSQAQAADAQAAAAVPSLSTPELSGLQAQVDSTAIAAFAAARQAAAAVPEPQRAQALAQVATAEAQYATARVQSLAALQSLERGIGGLSAAVGALARAQRVQTQAAVSVAQSTVDALTVRAPIAGTVQLGGTSAASASTGGLDSLLGQLPASIQGPAASALGSSGTSVASSASVAVGAPVATGTAVATVFDLSALELVGAVDETDIFLVRKGVTADVELDAVPDARYTATVVAVDLSPTESSRGGVTYRVRLSLGPGTLVEGGTAPRPRPGMSAVVDLKVRSAKDAVAVPAAAVIRQGSRDAVWLVVDGRARARVVRLGAQGDDNVVVLDGVRLGDRIVTRGADVVDEGDKVP